MTLTIEGFRDRVIDQARSQRHPVSCLFELTPVCNLRCHFCYVALDPYAGPYLTTAEVCRIIDIIERAGVLWLTFTGGEVFSRRDFPEIYAYAKRKGLLVTIFTNATMVNERIAAMLREDPPFSVEVSIYGADAEHYEGTTQIPGSFKRFDRRVRLLQEAGVPLLLKSPITTLNQPKIMMSTITNPATAIQEPGANWFSHREKPPNKVNSPIEPTIGQRVPCGT